MKTTLVSSSLVYLLLICGLYTNAKDTDVFIDNNLKYELLHKDTLEIQYIDLKDNMFLYEEIKKFITEQCDSSEVFKKGFGYVTAGNYVYNRIAPFTAENLSENLKKIVLTFNITLESFYIKEDADKFGSPCNGCYPVYYSFVDGRLVLIYDANIKHLTKNNYSSSSRKKMSGLVKKTLQMALQENFRFRHIDGSFYYLSKIQRGQITEDKIFENCASSLSSGRTVVVHVDNTVSYIHF